MVIKLNTIKYYRRLRSYHEPQTVKRAILLQQSYGWVSDEEAAVLLELLGLKAA